MFDHVKFGVSDYAASKAFFLKALEPLGVAVVSEGPPAYGIELSPGGKASLCLFQTREKPAHLHLAFTAERINGVGVDLFDIQITNSTLTPFISPFISLSSDRTR